MKIGAALLALLTVGARAEPPALGTPAAVSTDAVVANILVDRANVFDPKVPGENWWLFRTADKIHLMTHEKVIRDELLFAPGDRWDPLKIIESERNLRGSYPFRRVEISSASETDGRINAIVRTQDAWSTNPRIGIGTSGGQSSVSFGLEENNLLGYGKSITYSHLEAQTPSGYQRTNSYAYADPRFFGSRLALNTAYSHTQNDGETEIAALTHPFYALDTPRAMRFFWNKGSGTGTEIRDGESYSRYAERNHVVDAEYGLRLDNDDWFVQRVEGGWYENRAAYGATTISPGTIPGTQPANLDMLGPTIGYSWIQPRYVKETYIDRMERVEDFNLGNELRARIGYMPRAAGSDRDRWIFNAADQQGLGFGPGRFVLAQVAFSGRLHSNKIENGLATANLNGFWKNSLWSQSRTLVAHVEAAQGRGLDLQNQILLGGSNGLRGYKNDSFVGGRSILMNLEDRFFFADEYFHLLRFGGTVFFDSGSVVPEGSGFSAARLRSDIGAGLRTTSTRSTSGTVVRLDLAYALNHGPGSRWVVSLRAGQAFSFFNSASGAVVTSPGPNL